MREAAAPILITTCFLLAYDSGNDWFVTGSLSFIVFNCLFCGLWESDGGVKPTTKEIDLSYMNTIGKDVPWLVTTGLNTTPNFQITHVSDALCKLTGYKRKELIGQRPNIFQGPLTEKAETARMRDAMYKGEVFDGKLTNYSKGGKTYSNKLTVRPIVDSVTGEVTALISIQQDVTKEDAAEQYTEKVQMKMQVLQAALSMHPQIAVVEVGLPDEVHSEPWISEVFTDNLVCGLSTKLWKGRSAIQNLVDEDKTNALRKIPELVAGKVDSVCVRERRWNLLPNGEDPPETERELRVYDVYAATLKTHYIPKVIAIHVDVTEQVQAQQSNNALQLQMQQLSHALSMHKQITALVVNPPDAEHHELWVQEVLTEHTFCGLAASEWKGQYIWRNIIPEDLKEKKHQAKAIISGESETMCVRERRWELLPNGEDPPEDQHVIRTYDIYVRGMPTCKGLKLIGIIVDVTEQVQALQTEATLQRQVELNEMAKYYTNQANKALHHNFNDIISSLRQLMQMFREDMLCTCCTVEHQEILNIMNAQAAHLQHVMKTKALTDSMDVESVASLASTGSEECMPPRRLSIDKSDCEFAQVIEGLILLFDDKVQLDADAAKTYPASKFLLGGEHCLLHMAMYQALRNGIVHGCKTPGQGPVISWDFTPDHKHLCISIKSLPGENHVHLVAENDPYAACKDISNTKLHATASTGQGIGCIEMYAQMVGGQVVFEFAETGVTVHLTVPITKASIVLPAQEESTAGVVLLDDSTLQLCMLRALAAMVNPQHHDAYADKQNPLYIPAVYSSRRGQSSHLQTQPCPSHPHVIACGRSLADYKKWVLPWMHAYLEKHDRVVVFLDYNLEGWKQHMLGSELIAELKAQGKPGTVKVVMRSGNSSPEDEVMYVQAGADAAIGKEIIGIEQLQTKLAKLWPSVSLSLY